MPGFDFRPMSADGLLPYSSRRGRKKSLDHSNFARRRVTFTDLVLADDTFGTTALSTLNGTARW